MAATPFMADEYPGLLQMYRRLWNIWGMFAVVLVIIPGWAVIWLRMNIASDAYTAFLNNHCCLCLARFHDLQAYDGVSGNAYLLVMPVFLCVTLTFYLATLVTYVRARHLSRHHRPMGSGAYRHVINFGMMVGLLIFVIVSLPTQLSIGHYPGGTQLLAGYAYPVLAAFASGGAAICLLQISVFCLKALGY